VTRRPSRAVDDGLFEPVDARWSAVVLTTLRACAARHRVRSCRRVVAASTPLSVP